MPVKTSTPVAEDERSTTNFHTTAIDVFAQLRRFSFQWTTQMRPNPLPLSLMGM